jgi:NAD(P)-dependent dehydrogenase (short-subunit alcohol dehydrogenase family)
MLSADLSGKRALVTGASSGLGAHFAKVLARSGAEVILAARRLETLEEIVKAVAAEGGQASALALDVRQQASVRAVIAAAGPLDILVNNAGVTATAPALDQTEEDWDAVLGVNLKGAWMVALEAARRMRTDARAGSIINIASILGLRQAGQVSAYAVSKAGVIQLTKQLALELARFGVRVNALAPGYIETELNHAFLETDAGAALVRRVPQRRLGRLEELDGPLLLLASEASSYMTGSVVTVDGGHLVSSL